MLGGSYIKNADGSLTLQQRTEEPDQAKAAIAAQAKATADSEAKAAAAALDGASSSPKAEADGTAASANPETFAPGKPGKKVS